MFYINYIYFLIYKKYKNIIFPSIILFLIIILFILSHFFYKNNNTTDHTDNNNNNNQNNHTDNNNNQNNHNDDNDNNKYIKPINTTWKMYGDGSFGNPDNKKNREMLKLALQRSVDEIWYSYKNNKPEKTGVWDYLPSLQSVNELSNHPPLFEVKNGNFTQRNDDGSRSPITSIVSTLLKYGVANKVNTSSSLTSASEEEPLITIPPLIFHRY